MADSPGHPKTAVFYVQSPAKTSSHFFKNSGKQRPDDPLSQSEPGSSDTRLICDRQHGFSPIAESEAAATARNMVVRAKTEIADAALRADVIELIETVLYANSNMNLPIQFPSETETIREETRRFRALSPEDQVRALGEMFRLYHFLIKTSDRPEALARFAQEEEDRARLAVQQFVARHG